MCGMRAARIGTKLTFNSREFLYKNASLSKLVVRQEKTCRLSKIIVVARVNVGIFFREMILVYRPTMAFSSSQLVVSLYRWTVVG